MKLASLPKRQKMSTDITRTGSMATILKTKVLLRSMLHTRTD